MLTPQLGLDVHNELIIDNFAGGGGASCGIELALGRSVDAAINHDPEAVAMHAMNHPQTRHYCESVWDVDPLEVTQGRPVGLAWFSPDCKHFSKAKGGKPRDKKIRGLAWIVLRWAALVRPRVIMLENVEEFKTWGPLLDDGSPCPKRKGNTFRSFVHQLQEKGYAVEYRELRACDYGAPTIRKRLFLIARCDGQPIVWPEPTHGAPDSPEVKAKLRKPWRTAAECIDWSLPCPSIFERKRPLAEATLKRIARGIRRYVIESGSPFIVGAGGPVYAGKPVALDRPLGVIATENHRNLVVPYLTEHANGSRQRNLPADAPLRTQCAEVKGGHFAVVAPTLVQTGYGERAGQAPRAPSLDKPLGTVVAGGAKHALVGAFLAKHFGGNYDGPGAALDTPAHTVTTVDHHALVTAELEKSHDGIGSSESSNFPGAHRAETERRVLAAQDSGPLWTPTGEGAETRRVQIEKGLPRDQGLDRRPAVHDARPPGGMGNTPGTYTDRNGTEPQGWGQDEQRPIQSGGHDAQRKPSPCVQSRIKPSHACDSQGHACGNGDRGDDAPAGRHDVHRDREEAGRVADNRIPGHAHDVKALIIKYYSEGGQDQDCRDPMHTIPTKDRLGLVTVAGEQYQIADIGMRMLEPHELYAAQGFPASYIIAPEINGRRLPKHAQVRMCGNSVSPPMAAALVQANVPEMMAWTKKQAKQQRIAA